MAAKLPFFLLISVCLVFSKANQVDDLIDRLKKLELSYKESSLLLEKSHQQLEQVEKKTHLSNDHTIAKRATSGPVLFQAYLTRTYSTMSPNQVIPFGRVVTNVGSAYDPNFGLFTAPVSGLYEFVLTAQANPNNMVNLEVVRDDVMLCRAHAAARYYQTGVCAAMVHLSAGDDVWVRHANGVGTYLLSTYQPTFAGHLIKSD